MSAVTLGDFVMVVKKSQCCGDSRSLGRVFQVGGVIPATLVQCDRCGEQRTAALVREFGSLKGELMGQVIKLDAVRPMHHGGTA